MQPMENAVGEMKYGFAKVWKDFIMFTFEIGASSGIVAIN